MVILSFYFFAAEGAGVAEGAEVAEASGAAEAAGPAETAAVAGPAGVAEEAVTATRTVVPLVRESEGLTITLSDSVTPPRISDWTPKSRPTLTSRSSTTPLASTTPTCRFFPRNMRVLSGRIRTFASALCGTRTAA